MVKVAILGFGTVGSGVYDIFKENDFKEEAMSAIEVKHILDIRDLISIPQALSIKSPPRADAFFKKSIHSG